MGIKEIIKGFFIFIYAVEDFLDVLYNMFFFVTMIYILANLGIKKSVLNIIVYVGMFWIVCKILKYKIELLRKM